MAAAAVAGWRQPHVFGQRSTQGTQGRQGRRRRPTAKCRGGTGRAGPTARRGIHRAVGPSLGPPHPPASPWPWWRQRIRAPMDGVVLTWVALGVDGGGFGVGNGPCGIATVALRTRRRGSLSRCRPQASARREHAPKLLISSTHPAGQPPRLLDNAKQSADGAVDGAVESHHGERAAKEPAGTTELVQLLARLLNARTHAHTHGHTHAHTRCRWKTSPSATHASIAG